MFKKKTQPKTLREEVNDVTQAVGDLVRSRSAHAVEASGPYLEKANAALAAGSVAAAPVLHGASKKLQQTADQVRPQIDRLNERVRPQLDQLNAQMRDQADSVKQRFDEQVRPEIAGRVGGAAAGAAGLLASAKTPKLVEELAVRVTGDKKAMKKARKALAQASKDITKSTAKAKQVKKHKSGGGTSTAFIWILTIGGLAGVAYFVWKKAQPVEDPWSTPLPGNRPADARPVGTTPASKQSSIAPEVSEATAPPTKVQADDDATADPDSADAPESNVSEAADADAAPRH